MFRNFIKKILNIKEKKKKLLLKAEAELLKY